MPANLTPQYLSAEQRFREAATDEARVVALKEMLAVIPKHKGTDKLQADLKHRLAKLTQSIQQHQRSGGRRGDLYSVERHGAGQIALVGMPNVGKSSLIAALTNAKTEVADYPFTTHKPIPGMARFEDIQIQLVDMPPVAPEGTESWVFTIVRQADAAALLVDLGSDDVLDQAQTVLDVLAEHKIELSPDFGKSENLSIARVKAMFVGAKADLDPDGERWEMFREFFADRLDCVKLSCQSLDGLAEFPRRLYDFLEVIRVYTRAPGKKDDKPDPFVLKRGSTLIDLARSVHQDFAENLKFARIWGEGVYDGQSVKRDHVLSDHDLVELHM